jgi:hypothetical protein
MLGGGSPSTADIQLNIRASISNHLTGSLEKAPSAPKADFELRNGYF